VRLEAAPTVHVFATIGLSTFTAFVKVYLAHSDGYAFSGDRPTSIADDFTKTVTLQQLITHLQVGLAQLN
jgi:hypothetical protein